MDGNLQMSDKIIQASKQASKHNFKSQRSGGSPDGTSLWPADAFLCRLATGLFFVDFSQQLLTH